MGGGMDGTPARGSVAKVNGNRNVPYLNRNDAKRNLNLNWWNNDWNGNCRFLAVRHCHDFSRPSVGGSFAYNLSSPAAEHPAHCRKLFGKLDIFFVVQRFDIPRELQQELDQIDPCYTPVDKYLLVGACGVAGQEAILDCCEKHVVNFAAEGKAG